MASRIPQPPPKSRRSARAETAHLVGHDGAALQVDGEDLAAAMEHVWYPHTDPSSGLTRYAAHLPSGPVYLGHFVLSMHGQAVKATEVVFYKNGDLADARKGNLKVMKYGTAMHRREVPKRGGLGMTIYIGVNEIIRRKSRTGRYRVQISKDGEIESLGVFLDEELGARAYDKAAKQLHGEYARLNFPKG